MTKTPYQTTNRSLAIALHQGGARIIRWWIEYTADQLQRLGFDPTTDGVKEALKAGRVGTVRFDIERHPRLAQMIAAHDEAADAENIECDTDVDPVDAVRIATRALKTRVDVAKSLDDPRLAWLVEGGKPDPAHSAWLETEASARKKLAEIQSGAVQKTAQQYLTPAELATLSEPASFVIGGRKMIRADAPESTKRRLGMR